MRAPGKPASKIISPGSVERSAISPHFAISKNTLTIDTLAISQIKPDPLNARTHSARQIGQIANSILAFGFTNPLLVNENYKLIAGEGRWRAAIEIGLTTVPVIVVAGLSPAKRRALSIADNKIAANGGWDRARLAIQIPELAVSLTAEGLDVSLLGFEPLEVVQLQTGGDAHATGRWDRIDPTSQSGPGAIECGAQ
jgi:hypothetical protein